eukprot:TRINITY_DN611_c0_g1_i1.p1 TRINITY_DN611_c0_g1~~TRINITY_DN611_c0_g1_i1.p1  ORF type:complete len:219 (+),score=51.62 TRINITY_DN611_c0_g1_i1:37-693(+)
MSSPKLTLYGYWRSSASWRVRIALNLKGIDYDYRPVNLIKDGGEQYKDEYKALNPIQLLPTLVLEDGKTALTESLAIIEYLDEVYPENRLLPADPVQKALARAQALVVASDIQPVGNLRVLGKIAADYNADKAAWSKYWIEKGFTALEEMVSKTAGKYSVGDQITVADLCLVPQVYNASRWGVDMSKFPTLQRVNQTLSELPAFQKAHADNQIDAVKQ